ncbi:4-hydroxy-tetrahydrodipicolinate synthase [Anaerolentibacter hominis]|uniref:4-hydroxy-tetrahydrodipicolinate synthase n=1 Tax=Anaerolentibacter hominis TaxID=3079009 RepID=UPI0031B872C1
MKKTIFKGSGVAIVTPMKPDYTIDYDSLEKMIEYQISHHTDAIIAAGTTGEGSTLTEEEHMELIRFVADQTRGRVPVIAGAGSNCTRHAQVLSRNAQKAGADALLLVTPYYNKTSQRGLYLHFEACARAVDLPIILYNIPSRTGLNILPETYEKLSHIEQIQAVKEAGGNFAQIAETAALCGDRLDLYSGNDDQVTALLSLGGKGVISVLANILPEEVHRLCASFFQGEQKESLRLQTYYMALIKALFSDVNPIPVKEALHLLGITENTVRLPLCSMEKAGAEKLRNVLEQYGLKTLS